MKTKLLLAMLCLFCLPAFAQKPGEIKPALFDKLPASIPFPETILNNSFSRSKGETVSIRFSNDFIFKGNIVSNEEKYSYMRTVIIKSPELKNSLLSITKVLSDGKIIFTGRIINQEAGDGFHVKRNEDGSYRLEKFLLKNILPVCN